MELRRGAAPQELVHIGIQGVLIGPAESPLALRLFSGPRRSDAAWYYLRTYAPFEVRSPQGNLVFHSQGKVSAGAVEKRMIFEWARAVAAEAADSRVSEAYGLALAWHQGGSSGICRDVALYMTGETVASACGWTSGISGSLDPDALGKVYGWFDRLKPFQAGAGDQDMRQGSLETRLVFAGHGNQTAAAGEQAEMQSFGASLYGALAARKESAAPEAATTPAAPAAPEETAPPEAPAPPSHLLLPSRLIPPKVNDEIVLQLPDQPPPPPAGMGTTPTPRAPRPRPAVTPEDSTQPEDSPPPSEAPQGNQETTGILRSPSRATASS